MRPAHALDVCAHPAARLIGAAPQPLAACAAALNAPVGCVTPGRRVVLCGAISVYNESHRPPGPSNYFQLINKRARMEGFLSLDHWDRFGEVAEVLGRWLAEGKLTYRLDVHEGLGSAVGALNALFTGANTGKIVIRL